ncbi:MAG: hypothetical protein P8H59_08400 [Flavobacteriales bacterium]|nr:hypothetical protein [Flavobacteriales bacterium]
MNKNRVLWGVIITLAGINIYLALRPSPPPPPPPGVDSEPRNKMIQLLELSDDQVVAYDVLIGEHQHAVKALDQRVDSLKGALYEQLKGELNERKKDAIVTELSHVHTEIDLIHFNHFTDIKALCDHEQKANFDNLIEDIQQMFMRKKLK